MTEGTVSLWSFNDAMSAMSLPGREAMLERTFALQIGGRLNYKDVFENTPEALVASIVRQFNFWYDGLSPREQSSFLLLTNNTAFTKSFTEYICNKKTEIERFFNEDPKALTKDVSAFLAMRCYDAKIEVAKQGKPAFFCADGQRVAIFRMFSKQGRSFVHEASGRARKCNYASSEDMERHIVDIVHAVMDEQMGALLKGVCLPHIGGGEEESADRPFKLSGHSRPFGQEFGAMAE